MTAFAGASGRMSSERGGAREGPNAVSYSPFDRSRAPLPSDSQA